MNEWEGKLVKEDPHRVQDTGSQPRPTQLQPLSIRSPADRKIEVREEINSVEQNIGNLNTIFRNLASMATGLKEVMGRIAYNIEGQRSCNLNPRSDPLFHIGLDKNYQKSTFIGCDIIVN